MTEYAIISTHMLQVGDQFDRFQIQGHIAHGGMSDIYRAYDVVSHREVALKVPDASLVGDPAQYERFQREIEVLQRLNHPAILKGLGCGKYNRTPFLAMELVEGVSLRSLIANNAPMKPEEALPLMIRIVEGVDFCHKNDVIHRDLKPENIMITMQGQPVIMDFGLALTKSAHRVTYSNLSATAGTPDYMAPEQVEGKRGDARTDLYALGVMLYEMLSGGLPFTGDNQLAVMAQRMQSPAPRLDHAAPAVSAHLAAVVARCLQRDPDRRYADAAAFAEALKNLDTADLSLLEEASAAPVPWSRSGYLKTVGISLLVMLGIIVLALALQALR